MNHRQKTSLLAEGFPTLRDAPGVTPWDPDVFAEWLKGPAPGHGAHCAGRFVLEVWNPYDYETWGLKRFDLHEALACWDADHRIAFVRWCAQPWWP